jgi:hypothetical protein
MGGEQGRDMPPPGKYQKSWKIVYYDQNIIE